MALHPLCVHVLLLDARVLAYSRAPGLRIFLGFHSFGLRVCTWARSQAHSGVLIFPTTSQAVVIGVVHRLVVDVIAGLSIGVGRTCSCRIACVCPLHPITTRGSGLDLASDSRVQRACLACVASSLRARSSFVNCNWHELFNSLVLTDLSQAVVPNGVTDDVVLDGGRCLG